MFQLGLVKNVLQGIALFLHTAHRFVDRQLPRNTTGIKLRPEVPQLALLLECDRLKVLGKLRLCQSCRSGVTVLELLKLTGQQVPLPLRCGDSFCDRQLLSKIPGFQRCFQILDLSIL